LGLLSADETIGTKTALHRVVALEPGRSALYGKSNSLQCPGSVGWSAITPPRGMSLAGRQERMILDVIHEQIEGPLRVWLDEFQLRGKCS
jgi:hypothetical protein